MDMIARQAETFKPFEIHTADSVWQFCNCKSCQTKRKTLDSLPGAPIDYATFRLPARNGCPAERY